MEEIVVEGVGRSILVLHGGMGDLSSWERVTDRLRDRFRVARLYRRQYRLDVPRKVTMADEVSEVLAAAATLDRPVVVGHSSGAVLALEALVAGPPGLFAGAVLYEPPVMISDRPLGDGTRQPAGPASPGAQVRDAGSAPGGSRPGDASSAGGGSRPGDAGPAGGRSRPGDGRPIDRARAALAEGKPGNAFAIFLREIAGLRGAMVTVARIAMNRQPGMGPVVERQLDDNDAIDALGNRLVDYSGIDVPVLLVTGDQSPRHLRERLDALQTVLPGARRVTMHGQGHNAERSAPERLAEIVGRFVES
jgi:pimeloyl-ACP methyl ester carboxylesterase